MGWTYGVPDKLETGMILMDANDTWVLVGSPKGVKSRDEADEQARLKTVKYRLINIEEID